MIRFNDIKIRLKLNLFLSLAVVVVLAILGATLYHRQSKELLNNTDKNLKDQVKDLYFMVHLQIMERQSQINSAINSASEILSNSGNLSINTNGLLTVSAINQIDKSTTEISLPKFESKRHGGIQR
ncbi:MAG: hypothetical protein HC905_10160 [Bacteroidales bacterium]|nr:hypothetical protein [Bacteroidales bacterium]